MSLITIEKGRSFGVVMSRCRKSFKSDRSLYLNENITVLELHHNDHYDDSNGRIFDRYWNSDIPVFTNNRIISHHGKGLFMEFIKYIRQSSAQVLYHSIVQYNDIDEKFTLVRDGSLISPIPDDKGSCWHWLNMATFVSKLTERTVLAGLHSVYICLIPGPITLYMRYGDGCVSFDNIGEEGDSWYLSNNADGVPISLYGTCIPRIKASTCYDLVQSLHSYMKHMFISIPSSYIDISII